MYAVCTTRGRPDGTDEQVCSVFRAVFSRGEHGGSCLYSKANASVHRARLNHIRKRGCTVIYARGWHAKYWSTDAEWHIPSAQLSALA